MGAAKATTTLITFNDLNCGMSAKLWRSSALNISKDYLKTSKLKILYVSHPLIVSDEASIKAEKTLICALDNLKSDESKMTLLNELYSQKGKRDSQLVLDAYSKVSGKNSSKIASCSTSAKTSKKLDAQLKFAEDLDVKGTPTGYLLNAKEVKDVSGGMEYQEFKKLL